MEQDGNKFKTSGAFHFPDSNGNNTFTANSTSVTDTANSWHVYAMEWSADTIKLSVDDVVFHTLNNAQNAYFDNEHFILLNIAMGGQLGGNIAANFTSDIMEVDYVRVYQLQPLSSGGFDNQNIGVNIYPNPSTGQFYVEAADIINEIVIYDLKGRRISSYSVNQRDVSLQINQPPSVYLIKISGDDFEDIKKLIVN